MKTELVDHSATRKELKIEIDAAEVRAAYDDISDRYARLATVPGFRKGHATRAVVRQRFKNEIRSEVLQEIVPKAIGDAIVEAKLNVIGEPDIHLDNDAALNKFGEQPISVHAHVEVIPDVELGQYRGVEASRRVRPVTDEMADELIQNLRESSASLQPVEDRGAQVGDTVTVNFQGKFIKRDEEGNLLESTDEPIKADEVDVVLGGEGVLEDFTSHLLDARADDVRTFTINYPEDFSSQGLAGKEVEYTATVTAVRLKELPEMDDEWAKSLGEDIDTMEKLRERVRENLAGRAKFESEQRMREEVMNKLIEAHQFEVPETLLEHQTNSLLRSTLQDMVQRGLDPRSQDMNWESLRGMMREQADRDMRGSLLLERIADEENIDVTEEEIEDEINSIAQGTRQTVEQVRAALTKQGGERSIADRLRHRKALDLIIENASVRDEEWREEAEAETADAADANAPSETQESETTATANNATSSAAGVNTAAAAVGEHNAESSPTRTGDES
ncbi:MAG TPA: trigger factor [Pyrinomonadaceae bacterium]